MSYELIALLPRLAVAESPEQAKEWEERLLKKYFRKFGELPTLNSAFPKRYGSYEDPDLDAAPTG